jgi:diamine N-acetyltransferase
MNMIRLLQESDIEIICKIVNDNWKSVYNGYVNEKLLNKQGCLDRKNRLRADFLSGRLSNYVYEFRNQPIALLSIGDTADKDIPMAFELWRIYILKEYQNQGIGSRLLDFAEQEAFSLGHHEVVIWAFKENINAISFYEKHGYEQDKEQYLGQPYFAYGIRLSKQLFG